MEDDAKEGSHLNLYLRNYREKLRTMWSAVGQFLEEEFLTCLDFILRTAYHLLYNDNVCMQAISHCCIESAVSLGRAEKI